MSFVFILYLETYLSIKKLQLKTFVVTSLDYVILTYNEKN